MPHEELLYKLWRTGITGPLWSWFQAYLHNRQHFVNFEGTTSTTMPVRSGVPQGSVLGPLLFLIYINDIHASVLNSAVYLFADDTKMSKLIEDSLDTDQMQTDLDAIDQWCEEWKIHLNINKCSHVRFSLRGSDTIYTYHVGNCSITTTGSYKDLGIIVTSSLRWSDHLSKICAKAYSALYTIRRILPLKSSIGLRKLLYLSSVRSHLTYGSQVWRPYLLKDIKNLERVQQRATKFILQVTGLNYRERLLQLELLPLSMWLELQDILFLVRNLKNPSDNFNILDYVSFQKSNTRSSTKNTWSTTTLEVPWHVTFITIELYDFGIACLK